MAREHDEAEDAGEEYEGEEAAGSAADADAAESEASDDAEPAESADAESGELAEAVQLLAAAGRNSGLAILSGAERVACVPVYESQPLDFAVVQLEVSEDAVCELLIKQLAARGVRIAGREAAAELLRTAGYFTVDFDGDSLRAAQTPDLETTRTLSDGSSVTLGAERFGALEAYFKPGLVGVAQEGLHHAATQAIQATDVGVRPVLYRQVLVSGPVAAYPGITERLTQELSHLAPSGQRPVVKKV